MTWPVNQVVVSGLAASLVQPVLPSPFTKGAIGSCAMVTVVGLCSSTAGKLESVYKLVDPRRRPVCTGVTTAQTHCCVKEQS